MTTIEKVNELLNKHKSELDKIEKRNPQLKVDSDFTPDGISHHCISVFIEDLKEIHKTLS